MDHRLHISLELSRFHNQPDSLYSPEVKAFCTDYVCSNIHAMNFASDNCLGLVEIYEVWGVERNIRQRSVLSSGMCLHGRTK
jgi:hypothetical protein